MSTIPQSTTPRTDAAVYPMNGVEIVWPHFARQLETELSVMQSEFGKIVLSAAVMGDRNVELRRRAELAEAGVERLKGYCEQLHTIIDNKLFPSGTDYAKMTARAEKAEADTARLDWLEKEALEDWGIRSINRASIDAAMKEGSQ